MYRDIALEQFTKGELIKICTEKWVGRTVVAITEAVETSFQSDRLLRPVQTQNEIKRRFEICIRWIVELRRECHWSMPRILDQLPTILRGALDGIPFTPDEERSAWHGESGPELEVDGDDLVGELPDVENAVEAEKYLN